MLYLQDGKFNRQLITLPTIELTDNWYSILENKENLNSRTLIKNKTWHNLQEKVIKIKKEFYKKYQTRLRWIGFFSNLS